MLNRRLINMLEENNNRPSASAPTGEVGRKLSLRQELERRPWLLITMIVIIAALIGWLSYLAVVPAKKKLPTTDDCNPWHCNPADLD